MAWRWWIPQQAEENGGCVPSPHVTGTIRKLAGSAADRSGDRCPCPYGQYGRHWGANHSVGRHRRSEYIFWSMDQISMINENIFKYFFAIKKFSN